MQRTTSLSSLQYENGLLKERNRILAAQNQALLSALAQKQQCSDTKDDKNNREQREQQLKAIKDLITKLSSCEIMKRNNFKIIHSMISNNCSTVSLLENIVQIIGDQHKSDALTKISQRLAKRRERNIIKQQIVHIVKAPMTECNEDKDVDFVIKLSQRIVGKLNILKNCEILAIFRQIQRVIMLKRNLRNEEMQLMKFERSQQLGNFCGLAIEEQAAAVSQLYTEVVAVKKSIDKMIQQI